MGIDELFSVTSYFIKDVIDVFNGNLIIRIGNGSMTVLLFLQF